MGYIVCMYMQIVYFVKFVSANNVLVKKSRTIRTESCLKIIYTVTKVYKSGISFILLSTWNIWTRNNNNCVQWVTWASWRFNSRRIRNICYTACSRDLANKQRKTKAPQHSPDSKVHGANMGPTWLPSAPDGPHVGPMNCTIWEVTAILPRW